MLEILTAQQVPVKLCKTCADARGISQLTLADGVEIGWRRDWPAGGAGTVEADGGKGPDFLSRH